MYHKFIISDTKGKKKKNETRTVSMTTQTKLSFSYLASSWLNEKVEACDKYWMNGDRI